jgi:hypothetical protein
MYPTSPISNQDLSVNMLPGIIPACVVFIVAISLCYMRIFPFIVGSVLQMGSTPNLGSIVLERYLFKYYLRFVSFHCSW